MTVPIRQKTPPPPVIAASAALAFGGLALAASLLAGSSLAAVVTLALAAVLVVGLWRGNRGAQWVSVVLAALNLLTAFTAGSGGALRFLLGAALLVLLLVPASARAWFARA